MKNRWTEESAARVFQGMIDAKQEWKEQVERCKAEMAL